MYETIFYKFCTLFHIYLGMYHYYLKKKKTFYIKTGQPHSINLKISRLKKWYKIHNPARCHLTWYHGRLGTMRKDNTTRNAIAQTFKCLIFSDRLFNF